MRYGIILIFAAFTACTTQPFSSGSEIILSDTSRNASCAYMTRDAHGQLVISWVEEPGHLMYAVSADEGKSFAAARPVPAAIGVQAHAENMPKLVFRPNGEVIAMYGVQSNDPRNKYAGKVFYTRSVDGGANWLPAEPLVKDTASYDQRYFDLALLPSGEAAVIWLDNRKPDPKKEGSTVYLATTGREPGFQQEHPVAETACQCCRTVLYVDEQGAVHAAFRDIIHDTIRDMVHMVSTDRGRTFSPPVRISPDNWAINGCPHTGPALVKNKQGLHFAWFTMGGGKGVFYCRSVDNGITYTRKENISALPTAKHPQLTALQQDHVALVWDEAADTSSSRIGMQLKDGAGKTIRAGFITPAAGYANFPVLKPAGKQMVLVAYKKREGMREKVCAQLVQLPQ